MPPTWGFKDRPFLRAQNECIFKKNKEINAEALGGWGEKVEGEREKKSDSCHIPSHKDVRYAWSQVRL